MRKYLLAAAAALALVAPAERAAAGIYSDDLARCLVKESSDADKQALILWVFSAVTQHPQVKDLANIDATKRKSIDLTAGRLLERLLTKDCRVETVAALKYERTTAIQTSFGTLGQVAMGGLTSDPAVAASFQAAGAVLDQGAFAQVLVEAGITPTK